MNRVTLQIDVLVDDETVMWLAHRVDDQSEVGLYVHDEPGNCVYFGGRLVNAKEAFNALEASTTVGPVIE